MISKKTNILNSFLSILLGASLETRALELSFLVQLDKRELLKLGARTWKSFSPSLWDKMCLIFWYYQDENTSPWDLFELSFNAMSVIKYNSLNPSSLDFFALRRWRKMSKFSQNECYNAMLRSFTHSWNYRIWLRDAVVRSKSRYHNILLS